MNKLLLFVSMFFAASMFFACDKTKTAYELMKEEKKAINRFITENDFKVTYNPAEMYEKNVFFKTKEGLYINVIDSGNGDKVKLNQEVVVRFKDAMIFKGKDTTIIKPNISAGSAPHTFYYGKAYPGGWACDGWAIGLNFVRENAEVRLIIPSDLQPYNLQSSFKPAYFGYLIYRFK